MLQQARHLRKRGHKVNVYAPVIYWDKCFPELLKEIAPERIVPHLPFPLPFRDSLGMIAASTLPLGLRKMKDCDVMLCQSQPAMWMGYRVHLLFNTPYVGYLHQPTTFIHSRPTVASSLSQSKDFLLLEGLMGRFGRPIALRLDYLCHSKAEQLIFNSDYTRKWFESQYGLSGEVCYPAIDYSPFPIMKRKNQIAIVARHYPWKRIDLAFQILSKMKEQPNLVVAGQETAYTRTLKQAAEPLGNRVTFTGFISDRALRRLYAESRAYMQTSICEPFGIVSLEAQGFGCPAVVWGDAGIRETVLDGETGYHAKPYLVDDFSMWLDRIFEDKDMWNIMSQTAKSWASTFTWKAHIDQLESILEEESK